MWLDNYPHDVYVTDGSNCTFDVQHDRLTQHPVVQSTRVSNPRGFNTSRAEGLLVTSLIDAHDLSEYDMIFKITGRYYINNFEIPESHSMFYIQQKKHGFYHCEVVGFSDACIVNMFYESLLYCDTQCEDQIGKIAHLATTLPSMRNVYNTPRGGDQLVINPL